MIVDDHSAKGPPTEPPQAPTLSENSAGGDQDNKQSTANITDDSTREMLRRLELTVMRRLDGLLQGNHRGLQVGHGTELGETRQYQSGDDVRRIDWNVTARLQETHIRQTIAERELSTWLVIDQSARLDFGTALIEKRELALSATAAIGFLTNGDGNRIGAILAKGEDSKVVPSKGSRKHLLYLLDKLASNPREDNSGSTNLGAALKRCVSVAKRRGLVIVISDFFVAPGWERELSSLSRKHDVLAIQITDPREFELPDVGLIALTDPATGETVEVPTGSREVRESYAEAAASRQAELRQVFLANRVDHLVLSTGRDWVQDLVSYVLRRTQGRDRRSDRPKRKKAQEVNGTGPVQSTDPLKQGPS